MRVTARRDVPVLDPFPGLLPLPGRNLSPGPAAAELAPAAHVQVLGIRVGICPEHRADQRREAQDRDNRRQDYPRRGAKQFRM